MLEPLFIVTPLINTQKMVETESDKRNGFLEGNVLQELLSNIHKEEEFINDEKHVILGFKNGKGRNNL